MKSTVVDINVSYGTWPFQSFGPNSIGELHDGLISNGISQAFVSNLGSVFNPVTDSFNRQLIADCSTVSGLHPVPTVNPSVPGWRRQCDQLRSDADIRAIKMYPAYHNVALDSNEINGVVEYASAHSITVMIAARLEDERTRYHGLNVVGIPVRAIVEFCDTHSDVHVVCLNNYLWEIKEIGSAVDNVSFDTSFADWFFVMEELRSSIGLSRVLFGSHSPFLSTGASLDKIRLSRLSEDEQTLLLGTNARQLLGLTS